MTRDEIERVLDHANKAALRALPPEYYLPASVRMLTVRAAVMQALLALSDSAPNKTTVDWLLEWAGGFEK